MNDNKKKLLLALFLSTAITITPALSGCSDSDEKENDSGYYEGAATGALVGAAVGAAGAAAVMDNKDKDKDRDRSSSVTYHPVKAANGTTKAKSNITSSSTKSSNVVKSSPTVRSGFGGMGGRSGGAVS